MRGWKNLGGAGKEVESEREIKAGRERARERDSTVQRVQFYTVHLLLRDAPGLCPYLNDSALFLFPLFPLNSLLLQV